jgi:hypothetical protein
MSNTSAISHIFDQSGAQFVLLPAGKKHPPIEKKWQKKDHVFQEASAHIEKGGNVGVLAGNGFIGLDQDDPKAFAGLQLPKTTRWETRPGRLGLWFKCHDCTPEILTKHGFKQNQAQIKLFKNGDSIGEIKLQRSYQVIPPSWKDVEGQHADYKLLDDIIPTEISLKRLLSELQRIGITFSKKPKSTRQKQTVPKQFRIDKDEAKRYAEAAQQKEIEILSRATEGDRNNQLNKSAFSLGQLVGASLLDESQVTEELTKAALSIGLDADEIDRTIRSGLEEGKSHPRIISSQDDWRGIVKQAITHLAGLCDGAHAKDGVGFNKLDSEFCKDLAARITKRHDVSDIELKTAFRKSQKYERQLASAGISLPAMPKLNSKESMATQIVKQIIESGAELWHSEDQKAYITFDRIDHRENHPLRSSTSRSWLSKLGYEINSRAPGKQAVEDALNVLEGQAIHKGQEYPVFVRLASHEGKIYVDLGTPDWSAVEITFQGWQIVSCPPVKFRRPKTLKPLPIPKRGGSWDDLQELCNLADDREWILAIAWLIQAYWPAGPYAHLVITGEQGSGKSNISKLLKRLVDTSIIDLRRPPLCEKDLMIAAQEERIIAYDNLSGLRIDLSDALCSLATGGGLAGRKLYTDDEETFIAAKRPVILNGIDAIATRGDLLDRSIVIDLPRIPEEKRIRESDLEKKIEQMQSSILGLILDATAMGLKRQKDIALTDLPRMADFATWVVACEPALPWKEGEFMRVYRQATEAVMIESLECDSFAAAVIKLAADTGRTDLTPTNLWKTLNDREGIDERRIPLGWPKSANGVKTKLKRFAPQLRKVGVSVEFSRNNKYRNVCIWKMDKCGDEFRDNRDDPVTTQNQALVTTMTGVTAQSTFSLETKKEEERGGVNREDVFPKDKDRKMSSLPSLPLPDSELDCHSAVTRSSQEAEMGIKAQLALAEERQEAWEERFKTPERRKVADTAGKSDKGHVCLSNL